MSPIPITSLECSTRTPKNSPEQGWLERQWIELCDRRVTIPMRGGTDSLNVAVAAGHFTRAQS